LAKNEFNREELPVDAESQLCSSDLLAVLRQLLGLLLLTLQSHHDVYRRIADAACYSAVIRRSTPSDCRPKAKASDKGYGASLFARRGMRCRNG